MVYIKAIVLSREKGEHILRVKVYKVDGDINTVLSMPATHPISRGRILIFVSDSLGVKKSEVKFTSVINLNLFRDLL